MSWLRGATARVHDSNVGRQSILFIDAYDSFAQNIIALLEQRLNVDVFCIKVDTDVLTTYNRTIDQFLTEFDAVVLGPGPGDPRNPSDVGLYTTVWHIADLENLPVLGICLGFQSLCWYHGISVDRMPVPCHGHTKQVRSTGADIFRDVDDDVVATNYNSLCVRKLAFFESPKSTRPSSAATNASFSSTTSQNSASLSGDVFSASNRGLTMLAWDDQGYVMAARHESRPFWGVQFHPESCKSNVACEVLITNWWNAVDKHNRTFSRRGTPVDKLALVAQSRPSQNRVAASVSSAFSSRLSEFAELACADVHHAVLYANLSRQQLFSLTREMSAQQKVAMLESTRKGRFCIYAVSDELSFLLQYRRRHVTLSRAGQSSSYEMASPTSVLECVEDLVCSKRALEGPDVTPFWGGFIGFLSYEAGLADVAGEAVDRGGHTPDVSLLWTERSIILDQHTSTIHVQSIRRNDQAWVNATASRLAVLARRFEGSVAPDERSDDRGTPHVVSVRRPSRQVYLDQIRRCQEELHAGNSYELCLTTEAEVKVVDVPDHAYGLYQHLHRHNPVPFGAFLHLEDDLILSTSPEQFIGWNRHGHIDMVPMKGTVKRGPEMTLAKATAILSSAKESAENLMIADLIRHDLFSTVGTRSKVEVIKLCEVVEHETVYQLVSHVRAHVPRDETSPTTDDGGQTLRYGHRALRNSLPPGSMTGAPKKRSCEILAEVERRRRGAYSGVLGFMDVGGGGSWSVCIRTAFSSDADVRDGARTWRVGAGGAITILSEPESEWDEMTVKMESVLRGFGEDPGSIHGQPAFTGSS